MIDLEAVNAELQVAAFYDATGIEIAETFIVEIDWNCERRDAAREVAGIDRVIGIHYARVTGRALDRNAPNGKPDTAIATFSHELDCFTGALANIRAMDLDQAA